MSTERVLECNIQELNHMYYDQLRRVSSLTQQNAQLKKMMNELIESLSIGETVSLTRISRIKEDLEQLTPQ